MMSSQRRELLETTSRARNQLTDPHRGGSIGDDEQVVFSSGHVV